MRFLQASFPFLFLAAGCVTPHVGREVRSTWTTLVVSCHGYQCLLENRGDAELDVKVRSVTLEPGGGRARLAMADDARLAMAAGATRAETDRLQLAPSARVRSDLLLVEAAPLGVMPTCARVCLDGPAVECVGVPLSITTQACAH